MYIKEPSMFDPKYNGMESKEMLRELDRDKMLWQIYKNNIKEINYYNCEHNYNIRNCLYNRLDYIKSNIKSLAKDDKIILNKKNKEYYINLKYNQSILNSKLNDTFNINMIIIIIFIGLLLLCITPFQIVSNNYNFIVFLLICFAGGLISTIREKYIYYKINKIKKAITKIK